MYYHRSKARTVAGAVSVRSQCAHLELDSRVFALRPHYALQVQRAAYARPVHRSRGPAQSAGVPRPRSRVRGGTAHAMALYTLYAYVYKTQASEAEPEGREKHIE